jgi:hypothetical protein
MSYFRYLCLFVYSGVQHMSCLVYPMLPVSLDCPSLIAPTVFSNVYLFCLSSSCVPYVASFSGLSFFD